MLTFACPPLILSHTSHLTCRRSGAMITFKKLMAYMAILVFLLPWIVMATPCSLTPHVVLLVVAGLWQS